MWPPLYPTVLALFDMLGIDVLVAARWVNVALHAGLAAVAALALTRITGQLAVALVTALGMAMSPVHLDGAIAVMSESLFGLLVLCCLLVLARHLHRPQRATLIGAAILAALAWLTRYAGFALVATGCLLLLARHGRKTVVSLREAAVFGAIAFAPMAAWLLRNYQVSGTVTGERHPSPYSFGYFVVLGLQRVGEWFLPPRMGPTAAVFLGALVIVGAAAASLPGILARVRNSAGRPPWWDAPGKTAAMVFAAFTLIYIIAITSLISLSFATGDPRRVLAPAVPSALMLGGLLLAQVGYGRQRRALIAAATVLLLTWPVRYAVGLTQYALRNGAGGVASTRWRKSETIAYLRLRAASMRQQDAIIYSNEPTAVYLLTDLRSVYWLPPHDNPYSPVPSRQALGSFVPVLQQHDPTFVALFDHALEEFTYSRALVETVLPVSIVYGANDGAVYRVKSRPPLSEAARQRSQ